MRLAWRTARRNIVSALGGVVVLGVILIAICAGVIAPYDPTDQMAQRLVPPCNAYPLGTDEFGRDVLSRIIFGARISLYVGLASSATAMVVGTILGVLSSYARGVIDHILMRVTDVMFAFPAVILALAITGILGPSLTHAIIAIVAVYTPRFARVVRGPALSVMEQEFILAARMVGARALRIIVFHLLPNVAAPIIVQATLSISTAILMEASLSFLGLGTQPPAPSWGTMLGTGRRYLEIAPWVGIFPGIAITLTVLGFNLFGDGLRDVLDPTLREL